MTGPRPRVPLAWAATLILLAAGGIARDRLAGRSAATTATLAAAVVGLDRLPRVVGTWEGVDLPLDKADLGRAGIDGGILRRYADRTSGASVTVLLVCGRPGPISVHTPDVCYQGAGYELDGPPIEPFAGFRLARMTRVEAVVPDSLLIYWSWNAAGRWEAPAAPRLRFATSPALYKLYVIRPAAGPGLGDPADPANRFVGELAVVLAPTLGEPRGTLTEPGRRG